MSLNVYSFRRVDGKLVEVVAPDGTPRLYHTTLAGFESWRTTVWGSQVVRALGLRLLPALIDGSLPQAEGGDLVALAGELARLERELPAVVDAIAATTSIVSNADPLDTVRARLQNLIDAVALARTTADAFVVIW